MYNTTPCEKISYNLITNRPSDLIGHPKAEYI
jgi:hypothetical protein